jgi:hypothetical protein
MTSTGVSGTGVHDFDFLFGRWQVTNRRLKQRHVGCSDWEEFPSVVNCESRLGGMANVEEHVMPTKGVSGLAVRTFDMARGEWSIYWISSEDGRLQPPVVGRFEDGRGEFHGDDVDQGRPVRVRYRWSDITPSSARWEQAFSSDGGSSWETNWVMEFRRSGAGKLGPELL